MKPASGRIARFLACAALAAMCGGGARAEQGDATAPPLPLQGGGDAMRRSGDAAPVLTFDECVRRVLAWYPVLKKQHARVDEALAERALAVSGLLPRGRGVASVTATDSPLNVFGMLLNQRSVTMRDFEPDNVNNPGRRTNFNFGLQGEMPLFNAFQTFYAIRAAKLSVEASRGQESFTGMEASLLAAEAYLRLLLCERTYALAERVHADGEKDIREAESLKERGMILGADFYAAKVIQGGITQTERRCDARRRAARLLLNILMNEDPARDYAIEGALPSGTREAKPLADWLSAAEKARPDLAAVRAGVKAQEAILSKEKTSILPRVSALGAVEENTRDMRHGAGNYTMGFAGNMDFLDPSYLPRIQRARGRMEQLIQDEAILMDSIRRSISEAYENYGAVRFNLPVLAQAGADAREAVNLTAPLYREGRKSIKDLLEIRNMSLGMDSAADQLRYDSELGYATLLFLSGSLGEPEIREMGRRIAGAGQ
ncbi:MAG: TolC family protein [Chlamydiota bacterium]